MLEPSQSRVLPVIVPLLISTVAASPLQMIDAGLPVSPPESVQPVMVAPSIIKVLPDA